MEAEPHRSLGGLGIHFATARERSGPVIFSGKIFSVNWVEEKHQDEFRLERRQPLLTGAPPPLPVEITQQLVQVRLFM